MRRGTCRSNLAETLNEKKTRTIAHHEVPAPTEVAREVAGAWSTETRGEAGNEVTQLPSVPLLRCRCGL